MTKIILQDSPSEQLVDGFAQLAVAQDTALLASDVGKYNRLYDQMIAIEKELKGRPGDERRKLSRLYDHENAQVRLMAAEATLAVYPHPARILLEKIAASRKFPQAGYAGMTLRGLDQGDFKPS